MRLRVVRGAIFKRSSPATVSYSALDAAPKNTMLLLQVQQLLDEHQLLCRSNTNQSARALT